MFHKELRKFGDSAENLCKIDTGSFFTIYGNTRMETYYKRMGLQMKCVDSVVIMLSMCDDH